MEPSDMLGIALTRAITDSVSAEAQKEIFSKALYEHLFQKSRDGKTPVQEAFARALAEATREVAMRICQEPDTSAQIEAAIREAFNELLKDGGFVKKLAAKMLANFGYNF